ncbi:hypothetical protein [Paludisphaera sp.]|uniref:DUF7009 family protein n=1 Tax=Paludisphaera sp. TaxID=2017432 RepID=UPI00301DFF2B
MKLRLKGNSIRLRLDREDLAKLAGSGRVEDALRFGPGDGSAFIYAVEAGDAPRGAPSASYRDGKLTVSLNRRDVAEWAGGDRVGYEHVQQTDAGPVRILIEKDFACLDRPAGHDDDANAFPNPSASC